MAGWLDGWMAEDAPETIEGEEYFVHPLNPPETRSGQAPPAGDISSDSGVCFPPLAGCQGVESK